MRIGRLGVGGGADYCTKAPEKMGVHGMGGPGEAVDLGQKDLTTSDTGGKNM